MTGGGLGAARLNEAVVATREQLLAETSVFLISGKHQFNELKERVDSRAGWRLEAFVNHGMAEVLAAADVVVARAGATTLLELAALHKPAVIVPNGMLTAGHQLKNAKVYQDALAAVIVEESTLEQTPEVLSKKVIGLVKSPRILAGLGRNIGTFAKPNAAKDMAAMLLTVIRRQGRRR